MQYVAGEGGRDSIHYDVFNTSGEYAEYIGGWGGGILSTLGCGQFIGGGGGVMICCEVILSTSGNTQQSTLFRTMYTDQPQCTTEISQCTAYHLNVLHTHYTE